MRAEYAAMPDPFPMWRGGALHGARIAYETWGTLNAARDNALLLFTGLSPTRACRHLAAGSERRLVGRDGRAGLAIDTERFFVICVNSLGSCFGSTGPASREIRRPGSRYRLTFPDLSVEDIARAGYETVRSLGIRSSTPSWGPRSVAWWCSPTRPSFRGAARRLVCISGTAAAAPFAIALRSIQREIITSRSRLGGWRTTAPSNRRLRGSAWRASSAP